jgi:hypothetical protein
LAGPRRRSSIEAHFRAPRRLGYDAIADRLNADPGAKPPPQPVDPARAVGRWTGSAVREILRTPGIHERRVAAM